MDRRIGGLFVVVLSATLHATVAFAQSNWTRQFPTQIPSGRTFHAMAYDEDRKEVVLFGGIPGNTQPVGDTWAWDGFDWTQKSPANSPAPRYGHVMAFDAARHEVVLFGGLGTFGNGSVAGETWVWNGITWMQQFPATTPPPRDGAAMTYDPLRGQIVMFGGRDLGSGGCFGCLLDDTWVWDGVNWSEQFPIIHPSARIQHAMAFDASRGEVVLFGGRLAVFPSDFADTWIWNGVTWTQKSPISSPPPTGGHGLAFDSVSARVILFGGYDNGGFSRNDTWSWNGTSWALLSPTTSPQPRTNYAMAYDSTLREIVLFSGASFPAGDTGTFQDTWVFKDTPRVPQTKEDCKGGGWNDLVRANGTSFKNQGDCVSYVNTGR
jgi:hypothetical protein